MCHPGPSTPPLQVICMSYHVADATTSARPCLAFAPFGTCYGQDSGAKLGFATSANFRLGTLGHRETRRSGRGSNVRDGAEQHQRIIPARQEAVPGPKRRGISIQRVDHDRTAANQARNVQAPAQGMGQKRCADAPARPSRIRRKLPEQEARNWVGRLSRPDRPRHPGRDDGSGRKAVAAYDPASLMHDDDSRKAPLLVCQRPGPQPGIQGRLATCEQRHVVVRVQRFRLRQRQGWPVSRRLPTALDG